MENKKVKKSPNLLNQSLQQYTFPDNLHKINSSELLNIKKD